MSTRLFLMGVIILFFGVQLRAVDTFVLNEQTTKIINKRVADKAVAKAAAPYGADLFQANLNDPWFDGSKVVEQVLPTRREISPPRWLGWSFLSIGAVLVLTCPLFRV